MHDTADNNYADAGFIQDSIREPVGEIAPGAGGKDRPCGRVFLNTLESALNLGGEFKAQAWTLRIVVIHGLDQFTLGTGKNNQLHRLAIRSKTSLAGDA